MSVNDLPDYHNRPLVLTNDQIDNPSIVIFDFFTSYHLPDFRERFKKMLHDSLHERTEDSKEHYNTFNEVEKLVEACWIIRENIKQKNGQGLGFVTPVPGKILGKEATWIEKVKSEPLTVIKGIFKNSSLDELNDMVRDWHFVGSTSECCIYDEYDQRRQLFILSRELHSFIDILSKLNDSDSKEDYNPVPALNTFFEKFPIVYLRRELKDWLDAGILFNGKWPVDFTEKSVLECYETFLCLIEAAKVLSLTAR